MLAESKTSSVKKHPLACFHSFDFGILATSSIVFLNSILFLHIFYNCLRKGIDMAKYLKFTGMGHPHTVHFPPFQVVYGL